MDNKVKFGLIMAAIGLTLVFLNKQKYLFYFIMILSLLEIIYRYKSNKDNLNNKYANFYRFGIVIILSCIILFKLKILKINTISKIIIMTRIGDTLQQFAGKAFGKHKIGSISPNKTYEGYLGGALIIFFARLLKVFPNFKTKDYSLMYGASICGDLYYSYLKRKIDIKDWSKIFKEHGGAIDLSNSSYFVSLCYLLLRAKKFFRR